jgi:uncharacterized protein YbbC (DUF1343 family)
MAKNHPVTLGVTRLLARERKLTEGARVGLVANSASVNEQGAPTVSVLLESGVKLACIFSPEHGYDASAPPGERVADAVEPLTGLPIRSLYGGSKKPDEETLRGVDVIMFDLQDVGVRCYTYIWTMALVMQAAALYGKQFVVLDRPNPLGGVSAQGPVLDLKFSSFLGLYPIPLRHGMTAGELALLFNRVYEIGAPLAVVKMEGWRRRLQFADTGLRWKPPSPALLSPETAFIYAGACLFEGTNISEGRGAAAPFRLIGAPWLDPNIVNDLDARWTAGFALSLQKFAPAASKYRGEECVGVALSVLDKETADPVALVVELLTKIWTRHGERLQWRPDHFDAVAGTDRLRLDIMQEAKSTEDILNGWKQDLREFETLRAKYLLYEG